MRITPEFLEKKWDSIKFTDGGFLQIDTQHPLEWYIGYQSINQRTLILVCDVEIKINDFSKSMIVSRRKREIDKRCTLSFELLRNEQQGVFTTFCCDMIEYSRPAIDEKDALKLVTERYKQWSKLFETQRSGLMDDQRRKGLLGELLFLENRITVSKSAFSSIQGWVGADGADQDFMYSDGWYEVKSAGMSATSVTISSLEQLNCVDVGELVIQRIDKVAPERAEAFSLNEIVHRMYDSLVDDVNAFDLFSEKLTAYGYIDLQEYSEQKYCHTKTTRYRVDESFPSLNAENVPIQITSANYELNIASLINWEKE